jgi:hypothetical protein
MSWTRRFIWAFWIFVIAMLLWQFYQYNQKISTPDPQHPTQEHFFFYQPKRGGDAANAPVVTDGPNVVQAAFQIHDNTPTTSNFTCDVTLKNTGKTKAINVQVRVRPYRGQAAGDLDNGRANITPISDDSPLSQFGQWVDFPDLAPGESNTQSVTFVKQLDGNYGYNPTPEILFEPEKKK